jgi:hypothetical protein
MDSIVKMTIMIEIRPIVNTRPRKPFLGKRFRRKCDNWMRDSFGMERGGKFGKIVARLESWERGGTRGGRRFRSSGRHRKRKNDRGLNFEQRRALT